MNDLIDRLENIAKHAVHTVGENLFILSLDDGIALYEAIEIIKQQQKKGKWTDQYQDGDWHCSCCGAIVEKEEQMLHNWYFCYHCGADMREETEDGEIH